MSSIVSLRLSRNPWSWRDSAPDASKWIIARARETIRNPVFWDRPENMGQYRHDRRNMFLDGNSNLVIRATKEDGMKPYFEVPANPIESWPFNFPDYRMFPVLNLAVSGSGGGDPAGGTYPADMLADWVRIFYRSA